MAKKKGDEPFDYVAQMKNMNEASTKNKFIRFKWLREHEWLCDEYKKVHEEMKKLCEEKNACEADVNSKRDDRSVMPFPDTTNGLYGWLATKSEFNLEKFGPYIVKYRNPLEDVTLIPGDIPTLAAGKGLV